MLQRGEGREYGQIRSMRVTDPSYYKNRKMTMTYKYFIITLNGK